MNRADDVRAFVSLYPWTRRGDGSCTLPVAGAVLDQSASFIEAVKFFDVELARYKKDGADG